MVRHDTYDVGELENTRDGDGVSPLKEWTKEGYSIEGGELVKRVRRIVINREEVSWEKKRVEITDFRENSIVTATGETERVVNKEAPKSWDFEDWRYWAPKFTYKRSRGPELRWRGMSRSLVRGDLRWELPPGDERDELRERYDKGKQNYIYIRIPVPETEERIEEETIPIITIDFEATVTGAYYDSSGRQARRFDIEGTKTLEVGASPPSEIEDVSGFWERIWNEVHDEIFPHEVKIPGTTLHPSPDADVNGEWINRIMRRASGFSGSSEMLGGLTGSGLPRNAKWEYWYNEKQSRISSASGLESKVSSRATEAGVY